MHAPMAMSPSSPTHLSSHTSYSILVIAIVGILAIAFLLVSYYIFVIKWHRVDPLERFSFSRRRAVEDLLMIHTPVEENRGLQEAAIRAIPVLEFKKDEKVENAECAVCLNEFQESERLRCIPNCSHMFHIDCIDVWLQNNDNCPLCRNSIRISSTENFPMNPFMFPVTPLLQNPNPHSDSFIGRDEDYVVIEIGGGEQNHNVDNTNRVSERVNSGELSGHVPISPSPIKLHQPKLLQKKRGKELKHVSSMGDECIDAIKKDEQFSVQPIRRSISMDSAADRHVYLAIQGIIKKGRHKTDDVSLEKKDELVILTARTHSFRGVHGDDVSLDEGNSSTRVKRSFFSFGNSKGSKSSILPVDLEM